MKQEEKAKRRTDKKYRGVSLDNKIEKEDSVTSDEMGELHPQMELECPVVEEEKHTTLASAIFPPDPAMATGFPEEPVISGDFLVDDISQKLEESIPELLAQDVEKTETVETPKRKTRASDAEIMQEVHSVEAEIMDFVFETLRDKYPGKVLINPTVEIYHQYWSDNMIVLGKLTTEAPKGQKASWHTRLEKMLVDIMAEPLLLASISRAEYPHIYEDAFDRYIVDENGLFRYATRRKVTKKIKELIRKETDIVLRTKE